MLILLDPAHGHNTPGKRSPDGTLIEAIYTRQLVKDLALELEKHGNTVHLLVPESEDIPLNVRVKRINAICRAEGVENTVLISIHINAAGDGTLSDTLATSLYQSARHILKGKAIRTDYARDGDPDWEENFYILRHTHCPAVLIENFFMDNKQDLAYLLSQEGRREIIETIVDGIERCVLTLVE